jgi:hypothetical protein
VYITTLVRGLLTIPIFCLLSYTTKPAPNRIFLQQDSSFLKEVTHRMLKRRCKYRCLDGIAIIRRPLNRALEWYSFYRIVRLKYEKVVEVTRNWNSKNVGALIKHLCGWLERYDWFTALSICHRHFRRTVLRYPRLAPYCLAFLSALLALNWNLRTVRNPLLSFQIPSWPRSDSLHVLILR